MCKVIGLYYKLVKQYKYFIYIIHIIKMNTYKDYSLEEKLKKITHTFLYYEKTKLDTNYLYFPYENAYEKSSTRIATIINHINNKKKSLVKKYQVKGYHEFIMIKQYCDEKNIKCELIFDENILTNKVTNIKQYVTDYDYENNLKKIVVTHKKIPTMYVVVY